MRQPPKFASALLRSIGPLERGSVGDLLEEFRSGKSSGWYWRQVVSIVYGSMLREFRLHPTGIIACIGLGWLAEAFAPSAFHATIGTVITSHDRSYFASGGAPPPPSAHFIWIYNFAVWVTAYVVGGFLAARAYRGNRRIMALIFVVALMFRQMLLVMLSGIVIDASSMAPTYAINPIPLSTAMLWLTFPPMAALIGAVIGSQRRDCIRV